MKLMVHTFVRKALTKVTLLLLLAAVSLFSIYSSSAAELESRSVTITNPNPGEVSDQLFSFVFQEANTVGSIVFEYCSNTAALDTDCDPPSGLNAGSASLVFQSGETGFGVHGSTTAHRLVISRTPSVVTPGNVQYLFSNITNQTGINNTAYVRIYVYSSIDGTGNYVDASSVAYSTSQNIETSAYVPPHLIFCVGITVELDCSAANGNFIDLGELQPTIASVATSQYSGATNDPTGYTVSVIGTTMTSGNNAIPALAVPSSSVVGQSQFGINLRDNSTPDVGIEPIGPGTATALAKYDQVNQFAFQSGDILTQVINRTTSYDRFTVSYLVNVSSSQPAGIYNTTLSYIATASF